MATARDIINSVVLERCNKSKFEDACSAITLANLELSYNLQNEVGTQTLCIKYFHKIRAIRPPCGVRILSRGGPCGAAAAFCDISLV